MYDGCTLWDMVMYVLECCLVQRGLVDLMVSTVQRLHPVMVGLCWDWDEVMYVVVECCQMWWW